MSTVSPVERELAQVLARVLRFFRKRAGISQEEVARRAGIDKNHYQIMESGISDRRSNRPLNPQLFTIGQLADAFNIRYDDLIHTVSMAYEIIRSKGGALTDYGRRSGSKPMENSPAIRVPLFGQRDAEQAKPETLTQQGQVPGARTRPDANSQVAQSAAPSSAAGEVSSLPDTEEFTSDKFDSVIEAFLENYYRDYPRVDTRAREGDTFTFDTAPTSGISSGK
ncbi:helix-turn-helix transcriptional regulator [Arcanobacterium haemolyticum]|nr:helix-turn-helix transcriptional regulator [Arcanobacterium haemolyticum]